MTKWHALGLALAAAVAGVSLFSENVTAGIGFASSIATGIFGNALASRAAAPTEPTKG